MSHLLDTHVWLWAVLEPERLKMSTRRFLQTQDGLHLSPVSIWEAMLLIERQRLSIAGAAEPWVRAALTALPLTSAPLTTDVAIASRTLAMSHADPADRFIAATAFVYGLTLVTADRRLRRIPGVTVLQA